MAQRKAGPAPAAPMTGGSPSPSKALLAYNGLRLLLVAACLGIGYLATLRGLTLIVAALAVSGILSWFLLKKQRIAMGIAVEESVSRGRVKMAARTAAEDEYADSVIAQQEVARQAAEDQPQS